jgi:small subunit ribosomal protein S17e
LDRIKRLSYEVLDTHKSKFGEDFADNKKALDQIAIIRSKGLKNEIAGYITKFIKKETREEKIKQSQIESARLENSTIKEKISELEEGEEIQEEMVAISDPDADDIVE